MAKSRGQMARRTPPSQEAQVACAHKEMAIATTGVVQALEVSQVLTKGLQGIRIKLLQR
jgi:hypothetical protein